MVITFEDSFTKATMNSLKSIIIHLLLVHLLSVSITFGQEFSCFSILTGKDASADGSVLFAHNEDDWGDRIVNIYKVPVSGELQSMINSGDAVHMVPSGEMWSYLWFEMPEMEFSDSYMNQWGVTISSNACSSREDNPDLTEGGIGYMLRTNMARRARSAREAVRIGGELIETYGYTSSGRTYCIADLNESWMLAVVQGKQWVAQRVPDDHVAIIPNYYTISAVNLEDTINFYGSQNLVDYAMERGWFNPETEGEFSFRQTYGNPESLSNMVNVVRHWSALNFFSDMQYEIHDEFPFSFTPERKVELRDLFRILRNHNEGSQYDYSKNYTLGHPHAFEKTICTETTQYGFVAQLRRHLPHETGLVIWLAPYRPCVHPFIPVYFGITEIPEGFYTGDHNTALEAHFEQIDDVFAFAPENSFLAFVKHAREADRDYINRIEKIREETESFENELLGNQEAFERKTEAMIRIDPEMAAKKMNEYVSEQWKTSLRMIKDH
jgi:dipeptidase